jgi:benzoyl-CoA reductase/2-hydroxyglutaryl-CoA dehydratase subunit BcrC/BadD/HgdB
MNNLSKKFVSKNETSSLVDKVVEKLDLKDLPEEELRDFRESLEMQITRRLGLIILENLNEEGLKEYEEAISSDVLAPDSDRLEEIIKKYIPDLDKKIQEGMTEFLNNVIR